MYEPNIVELAGIKYRVLSILPVSSLLSVSTLSIYLIYRIWYMITTFTDGGSLAVVLNSFLYFVAELGLLFPGLLNHLLRCLAFHGHDKAPHLRILDKKGLPRVDVFITCAGEEPEMVENVAAAACGIDYPSEYFRVLVLDDGGSEKLPKLIDKLSKIRKNLFYTARVKGENHHFKAGNLNHGVKYVESLPGGAAEYIAALDADMIPDPQWLRALLPHMLKNPKLSLAQPPQRFYDVPTEDPLLQGLDVNFKVVEPLKEAMSSTWCGGSGYILRRAALDDIGGFPTESVGEDMYCSNVLLGKGWKTIYVDETLQMGRTPESYKAHVKQQSRWHVGRVQTAVAMKFYLYGDHSRLMGIRQRLIGLIYVLLTFCNVLTTVGMVTLLLSLLSTHPLIAHRNAAELHTLIRLVCVSTISEYLDDCIVSFITGYRIAISEGHINYWIAPFHAAALIRAFLPESLQSKKFEFTASGVSDASHPNTASPPSTNPLQKARSTLSSYNLNIHLLYLLLLTLASAFNIQLQIKQHQQGQQLQPAAHAYLACLHPLWPPVPGLLLLNSFLTPLLHALHPPTIPNRAQLLKKDPVRRASYPDSVREDEEAPRLGGQSVIFTAIMVYTGALGFWSAFVSEDRII